MTGLTRSVLLGLALSACSPASLPTTPSPAAALTPTAASPAAPPAPAGLQQGLRQLAESFDGGVGIAVESVGDRWAASVDGDRAYPQQSVSKLWVALAVLDQVERGAINLDTPVLVQRSDMSVFHQPIQTHLSDRGYTTTIDALLMGALAQSDNAANDILVRRVGGPSVVQRIIETKRLAGLRSGPDERVLQSKIAGLTWRPEYSFGRTFWTARDQVAPDVRTARLAAYLADPDDAGTPLGIVGALARLKRGELLSPASTERLIQILAATETGPNRLKAGLSPGWSIAHKTGTGQVMGDLATGYNDVGLITSPEGRTYAVAVLIASTRRPVPQRQRLMAEVAAAVVQAEPSPPAPERGAPTP